MGIVINEGDKEHNNEQSWCRDESSTSCFVIEQSLADSSAGKEGKVHRISELSSHLEART